MTDWLTGWDIRKPGYPLEFIFAQEHLKIESDFFSWGV